VRIPLAHDLRFAGEEQHNYVGGGVEFGEDDDGDEISPEEEAALAAFMAPGAANYQ